MEAITAQLNVLNKELEKLGEKIEELNTRLLAETDQKKEHKLENQIKQREEEKKQLISQRNELQHKLAAEGKQAVSTSWSQDIENQLEREKRKRKADIARLERENKLVRRSISEARQIGNDVASNARMNLSFFEKLLYGARTQQLLEAFLATQQSRDVQTLLRASKCENEVQKAFNMLLKTLTDLSPPHFFTWIDTHDGGIPLTRSKPDLVIVEGVATKPHIASVIELKWDFNKDQAYKEAIGQCSDRSVELDRSQPRRTEWLHAIADWKSIEFWLFRLSGEADEEDICSGLLPFDLDADCMGLRMLAGLLLADSQDLGYKPIKLPKASMLLDGRPLVYLHMIDSLERADSGDPSEKRGCIQIYKARVGQTESIVKVPGNNNAKMEAQNLAALSTIPALKGRAVELVQITAVRGNELGLVLQPAGELLNYEAMSFEDAIQAIRFLVHTVMALFEAGYLHADLSYRNIIQHNGRVLLIDFRTLRRVAEAALRPRTGTTMFIALQTLVDGYHSLATELECLFMVLLFLLGRGQSPWSIPTTDDAVLRKLRLAAFCTDDGWQEVLLEINPAAHETATALKNLFYPDNKYSLEHVNGAAFLAALG